MNDDKRFGLDELTLPVATDGSPYYKIGDFRSVDNDATAVVVMDLAERLHEAVVRAQLANAEGHPTLSAWLPAAHAALAQAWVSLPPAPIGRNGER